MRSSTVRAEHNPSQHGNWFTCQFLGTRGTQLRHAAAAALQEHMHGHASIHERLMTRKGPKRLLRSFKMEVLVFDCPSGRTPSTRLPCLSLDQTLSLLSSSGEQQASSSGSTSSPVKSEAAVMQVQRALGADGMVVSGCA